MSYSSFGTSSSNNKGMEGKSSSSPVHEQLGCKLNPQRGLLICIFEGKLCITQGSFNLSSKNKQALRLTESAEKVKMELSSLTQTNISLPFITPIANGPKHIDTTLTRVKNLDASSTSFLKTGADLLCCKLLDYGWTLKLHIAILVKHNLGTTVQLQNLGTKLLNDFACSAVLNLLQNQGRARAADSAVRAPIKLKRVVEKVEKLRWKCLQYRAASQW
ncbi:hypothetical protein CMV_027233 [Castanea mollissima]|uniref:Uncharacterized protein n=1 Tax=Castanea mollissima TaxID=60419 RepID=A0A8J4V9L0_9ROSI|nr:hypothetical protein CMV_027233 [Castanea mollissima]